MISKEEIKHIAKLARIRLTDQEVLKFQKELSLILDYIEELKQADTSNVDLKKGFARSPAETRKDKGIQKPIEQISRLIELMPNKKDNYLKTKKIL
jgi:aspartyl-tRNA(Asn)/glutamyl-tRNA(Gln) amidotransferase subunit C